MGRTTVSELKDRNKELGIIDKDFDKDSCPNDFQKLFQLIHDVQDLEYANLPPSSSSHLGNVSAPYNYAQALKQRAANLSYAVQDPKAVRENEEYVVRRQADVFARCSREWHAKEEKNYCYICQRYFQPKTKFFLQETLNSLEQQNSVPLKPGMACQKPKKHLNLPDIDCEKLRYTNDDGYPGDQTPDLTVGLQTYDQNLPVFKKEGYAINDWRIQMFASGFLRRLLTIYGLQGHIRRSRSRGKDLGHPEPVFGFMLYEAKKHKSSEYPLEQTKRKIATLLRWQQSLFVKAKVEFRPLLWCLTNKGDTWQVYGCYCLKTKYIVTELWNGNISTLDSALQLLYIMEVVAVWAEQTYKPIIAACIWKLVQEDPVILLSDLCREHPKRSIPITDPALSWLFDMFQPKVMVEGVNEDIDDETYVFEDYVWISNEDPGHGDLLVICVNHDGILVKPVVMFDCNPWTWQMSSHRNLVEEQSYHNDVEVIFAGSNSERRQNTIYELVSVMTKSYSRQICFIVPLDQDNHSKPIRSRMAQNLFRIVEEQLGLPKFLSWMRSVFNQCCICKEATLEADRYERYDENGDTFEGPGMILCSHSKCKVGWYHRVCMKLRDESVANYGQNFLSKSTANTSAETPDPRTLWLCPDCSTLKISRRLRVPYSRSDDRTFPKDLVRKSRERVHRTKAIGREWADLRPRMQDGMAMEQAFEKMCGEIEIDKSHFLDFKKSVGLPNGCWALSRDDSVMLWGTKYVADDVDATLTKPLKKLVIHATSLS